MSYIDILDCSIACCFSQYPNGIGMTICNNDNSNEFDIFPYLLHMYEYCKINYSQHRTGEIIITVNLFGEN
jgi:hypothetical protein